MMIYLIIIFLLQKYLTENKIIFDWAILIMDIIFYPHFFSIQHFIYRILNITPFILV